MSNKWKRKDHTKCVAAGDAGQLYNGALVTPIFQTTNYVFADSQDLIDLQEGKAGGYLYSRYANPGIEAAEKRLAALENGEQALLLSSGMAATATICMTFLKAGDRLLASGSLYGGTTSLFNDILSRFGVQIDYIPLASFDQLADHLDESTRLLWFETPVNPTLGVLDIAAIANTARERGVLTVCDNTFASPINQKPLDLGVDLVMHSASKYIGGHSDVIGGAVIGCDELISPTWKTRKFLGGCMDPHAAFLVERGLKTLAVRVERHNFAAQKIAEYLDDHPKVRRVFYPGLPDSPGHTIAAKQMSGFGGMVSFEVYGGLAEAIRTIDSLELIANATSLGGVESLASLPALTSQYFQTPEERAASGISDALIRLSAGLEDVDDLCADLDQALNA